ncbi:MAG: DUF2293 domain-containing protein [Chthoniobacterales bacterium]
MKNEPGSGEPKIAGADPARQDKSGELVVFISRKGAICAECADEIFPGAMLTLNREREPLCLGCADLAHLEFLPRGDAALTRRATKHSRLRAVAVQWSRARKHYERQGVLVEPEAIERAETECLEDVEARSRQRERRRVREAGIDREYVTAFAENIRRLFPKCPAAEAGRIAVHACRKYSGRVGRTAEAKEFEAGAIGLAVAAAVRHRFTNYDELLARGYDRHEARAQVRAAVERQLAAWQGI